MRPKLSVIVAVYNAEATLPRTLQSLAVQTATEVEYLLVNDGSTDGSAAIMERFAGEHTSLPFRIITHPHNMGVVAAFRSGLKAAEGEYLIRCDADDELTPDYYSDMLAVARETGADMVCSPYTRVWDKGTEIVSPAGITGPIDLMPVDTAHFSLCNKIIKRSLLDGIWTDDDPVPANCWDDLTYVAPLLALQPSVALSHTPGYIYHDAKVRQSLSRAAADTITSERCANARLVEKWLTERGLANSCRRFITNMKFHAKVKMLSSRPRRLHDWLLTFPEVNRLTEQINGLSTHHRLLFAMAARTPLWLSRRIF